MATIAEMARAEPNRIATLSCRYLEIGLGARGAVRKAFKDIEKAGGRVSFQNEYRGWFETTYTHVKIEGPAYLLAAVDRFFQQEV